MKNFNFMFEKKTCPVPLRVGDVAGAAVGASLGIATTAISIAGDVAKVAVETPIKVVETVANIHLLPELPTIPIPQISIKI